MKNIRLFLCIAVCIFIFPAHPAKPTGRKALKQSSGHALPQEDQELIKKALRARKNAYAIYSKFSVGSAIAASSGKTYSGCNVENASFGLTNCAERSAVFKAVSSGEKKFSKIVVATEDGSAYPCGACRQVLNEFAPDILIILADKKGKVTDRLKLSELLPHSFGPENLN